MRCARKLYDPSQGALGARQPSDPAARAFRSLPARLLFLALAISALAGAPAKRHARADRAIGASLLTTIAGASSSQWWPGATARLSSSFRLDFAWGPAAEWVESRSPLVVGVRLEDLSRDTSGIAASLIGVRLGVTRAGDGDRPLMVSAAELSVGVRSLRFLTASSRPDVGFDVVIGRGDFGSASKGTLGFRLPVELVRAVGAGRVSIFAVPTVAWGHLRIANAPTGGPAPIAAISACSSPSDARGSCSPEA